MSVIVWACLLVAFVIAEIITIQLVSIWLAAGAFITMLCCYFIGDIPVLGQLVIFIVTSTFFLVLTMPYIRSRRNREHISTNSELDVGKSATVIEEINPDNGTGRVTLGGVDWSALSETGDIIPKDSIVTVTEVMGAKLKVKKKE